jgi:hypothetical protein
MKAGFGIFIQDGKGPMWQDECSDLAEAKERARELANTIEFEVFVFCMETAREVARFSSTKRRSKREAASDGKK